MKITALRIIFAGLVAALFQSISGCSTINYGETLRPYRITTVLPLTDNLAIGSAFEFQRMPKDIYDETAIGTTVAFPLNITNGLRTNQVFFPEVQLFSTNGVSLQIGNQSLASFAAGLQTKSEVTLKVAGAFCISVPEINVITPLTTITNENVEGQNVSQMVLKEEMRDSISRLRCVLAKQGTVRSLFTGYPTIYNTSHSVFRVATEVFYATNIVFTIKPKRDLTLGIDPALLQQFFSGGSLNMGVTNHFDGSYTVNWSSPNPIAFGYRGTLLRINLHLPEPNPIPFQVDRIIEDR